VQVQGVHELSNLIHPSTEVQDVKEISFQKVSHCFGTLEPLSARRSELHFTSFTALA
jgi:hypothetical protein